MSITSSESQPVEAVIDILRQTPDPATETTTDTQTLSVGTGETVERNRYETQGTVANQGTVVATEQPRWSVTPPDQISHLAEVSGQERTNTTEDRLYVWAPVDADIQRFSADGKNITRFEDVQVLIYVLDDKSRCAALQRDIIKILGNFMTDNKNRTDQSHIEPVSAADLRNEHQARTASYHVMGVTVEARRFRHL